HAFRLRDDDLGPFLGRGQGFFDGGRHLGNAVGAVEHAYPLHAHALHGVDDGVVGGAAFIGGAGRQNVLPARGGGVEVVDDDDDAVVLVEDGVAYAGCQAVVPEAAVAHDGDGALGRRHVEGRGAGGAQAVVHGRGAQVEGRQNREQMA